MNGKRATKPHLPVVQISPGVVSSLLEDRKKALDDHLQSKFKTLYKPVPENLEDIDTDIFTSTRTFSEEVSEEINKQISEEELKWAINKREEGKAPGVDKITTKMIIEPPDNWRTNLLTLFRNIQLAGTRNMEKGTNHNAVKKDPGNTNGKLQTNHPNKCPVQTVHQNHSQMVGRCYSRGGCTRTRTKWIQTRKRVLRQPICAELIGRKV